MRDQGHSDERVRRMRSRISGPTDHNRLSTGSILSHADLTSHCITMDPIDTLTVLANFTTLSMSGQPTSKLKGAAETHALYREYLMMVGPQKKLRIHKVSVDVRLRTFCLTKMQGSTQKLVLAAEALALGCLQLFSKDCESKASFCIGEKKLEELRERFMIRENYMELLR